MFKLYLIVGCIHAAQNLTANKPIDFEYRVDCFAQLYTMQLLL